MKSASSSNSSWAEESKMVNDFVEFLVNLSPHHPYKKNVTRLFQRVDNLLKSSKCKDKLEGEGLRSAGDNLERIKRFKDGLFGELKGILDEELLDPLKDFSSSSPTMEMETDAGSLPTDLLRKSEGISALLRNQGNEYYKRKDLNKALRCYTLACSYAPKGSTFEALAYSNRSACFFETNDFQTCLEDIERFEVIWTLQDDLRVAERLSERKIKCLNKLLQINGIEDQGASSSRVEFDADYFTLKNPSKTIPSAEQYIGIRDDELRGRHVANIGDEAILPGTVVILEQPYAFVLLKTYSFEIKHCSACLKDLNGGGIPCEGCVFALYCSEKCASSPHHKLHASFECKISPYLYELNMNRTIYLSLLILINLTPQGLLEHLRSVASSKSSTESTETAPSSTTILGFSTAGTYDSSSYSTLYNLIYHFDILSDTDVIRYCTDAMLVTEILDAGTDFFKSLNLDPVETCLLKDQFSTLLLLHQMNLPCNAHSLYKLDIPKNPTREQSTKLPDEVGAGAFPLLSMINHSCDPNVVRATLRDGLNAVITIQHIAPGQELVDNYGSHYALDGRKERQSHLQFMYNFKCSCPACEDNWPTINELDVQPDTSGIRICPKCRMKLDAGDSDGFSDIMLSVKAKTKLFCPKCKWSESQHDWLMNFNNFAHKYSLALENMLDNKPDIAFSSGLECLKFFDARFLKPYKYINLSQEVMKQGLNLIIPKILK